jgi:hypothetical protein
VTFSPLLRAACLSFPCYSIFFPHLFLFVFPSPVPQSFPYLVTPSTRGFPSPF